MKALADLARPAVAMAVFAALSTAVQAEVTYTYTGPELDSFAVTNPAFPVTASGVVASFVFDAALAPNIGSARDQEVVTPISWSIAAGGYSLSSSDSGARLDPATFVEGFRVHTDASGAIRGWDISAYIAGGSPSSAGPTFRSVYLPEVSEPTPIEAYKYDVVVYADAQATFINSGWTTSLTGGTWTVSAVSEPGTTAMWLAGAGALGLLLRRRGQA